MAGYIVYRPVTDDRNRIEFDIGGVLVNGADAAAAKTAAIASITKYTGPNNAAIVSSWTALELNASDFAAGISGTVIQGPVCLPGSHLRGGGIIVT